jgi:flagellar protein FlaG
MNEVRPTQVTPVVPKVASAASSHRPDEASVLPSSGKELPVKENKEVADTPKATDIEQAVTEINDYVQSVQRDLHFSVDEDSGLTVIRVRDKESGELIRQIPEDIFLSLAQNLKDNQPIHLFDAHG